MKELDRERYWRVVGLKVEIEPLDENEFAVFHGLYLDSYLFNAIDVCLLRHLLRSSDCSTAESELASITARELDLPVEDLRSYIGESLSQMAYVGLISQEATC